MLNMITNKSINTKLPIPIFKYKYCIVLYYDMGIIKIYQWLQI